ncbi:hypothetical protein Aab01nite_21520 [Paractinoplanes abujensis]|uniref:Uncharacterized protein n=1 Tax=Paractinoplanes abujensis TaxID=882441 RepID=A0A7W7D1E0_9ACTN|nr:hypothetical protein [Actinoplanes abujensis]MBB4696966.1 hypothetical protein [Actinoplanes abujensis]GID18562.1 hypothetical protein Aab01nite_21520 [Actinoplanes abujensis]
MKKTMRVVAASGLGLMAGLTMVAGPAQAAGATAQSDSKPAAQKGFGRDDIVGYFRSPVVCEVAGRLGERQGRWEDYDCEFVHVGFRRGGWVLRAEECDLGWGGHGHHHKPGKPHGSRDDDDVKGDGGYTKPAATKPDGYTKPAGTKPAATKDDGYTKPAGTKPAATKDDAYTKPAGTKPAATKDDGYTKPAATKPDGYTKPQAADTDDKY